VLSLAALAGALAAYPLHLWMIRRGMIRWGEPAMIEEVAIRGTAWYQQAALLLLVFVIMLAALASAILLST
jgi:hypothetical protein